MITYSVILVDRIEARIGDSDGLKGNRGSSGERKERGTKGNEKEKKKVSKITRARHAIEDPNLARSHGRGVAVVVNTLLYRIGTRGWAVERRPSGWRRVTRSRVRRRR